jgi:hypothetical protein
MYITSANRKRKKSVTIRKLYNAKLTAPITKTQIIGKIDFMLGDVLLGSINLLSTNDIKRLKYTDYYIKLLDNFFRINYLY